MNKEDKLTEGALTKWGMESQIGMLVEECAEVIQSISHFRRGRCDLKDVSDEIADLEITLGSVKHWIDNVEPEMLSISKAEKLSNLERLLGEG